MTSTATSMSRTAIHERPTVERTMFLAIRAMTATMPSTSRYFSCGESNLKPRISICCAVITPDELLLVNHGTLVRHHTTKTVSQASMPR